MPLTQVQPGMLGTPQPYNFKNRIINGGMVIDQRNSGAVVNATGSNFFCVDRFAVGFTQSSKYTLQQNAGSVTPPVGFSNYLGMTSSSSYSVGSGDTFLIAQNIEGFNFADMAWGTASAATVTLSFWVRSSLTGTFGGALTNGAANRSYPYSYTISAANTWEYKTITIAGDTTGTWVGATNGTGVIVRFGFGSGSTYTATAGAWGAGNIVQPTGTTSVVGTNGATWYVTGVQLEQGVTATSFDFRSYGQELALAQRYFAIGLNGDTDINWPVVRDSSTNFQFVITVPAPMRATPTLGVPSGFGRLIAYDTSFSLSVGSVTALTLQYFLAGTQANIYGTNSSISGSAGVFCGFDTAGRSGNLTFSAEL
jgi:hypothetical protein